MENDPCYCLDLYWQACVVWAANTMAQEPYATSSRCSQPSARWWIRLPVGGTPQCPPVPTSVLGGRSPFVRPWTPSARPCRPSARLRRRPFARPWIRSATDHADPCRLQTLSVRSWIPGVRLRPRVARPWIRSVRPCRPSAATRTVDTACPPVDTKCPPQNDRVSGGRDALPARGYALSARADQVRQTHGDTACPPWIRSVRRR